MRKPILVTAVLTGAALLSSCGERPSDERPRTGSGAAERVAPEDLTPGEKARHERAVGAARRLFSELSGRLMRAVGRDGFGGAVGVCRDVAPRIAGTVSRDLGVRIGRTSHRLRNPENRAPDWAEDALRRLEAGEETLGDEVYRLPDGTLGYVTPIPTMDLCLHCHGSREGIDPEVLRALGEHYPEDRAVGFEAGEPRGFAWVEVPGEEEAGGGR